MPQKKKFLRRLWLEHKSFEKHHMVVKVRICSMQWKKSSLSDTYLKNHKHLIKKSLFENERAKSF